MGVRTLSNKLEKSGEWIPLMDYAMKNSVSLSTLRRYIKAGKVQYRVENGKYLILSSGQIAEAAIQSGSVQSRIQQLELDLQKAQEEIGELKMLVAIYEEKISNGRMDS